MRVIRPRNPPFGDVMLLVATLASACNSSTAVDGSSADGLSDSRAAATPDTGTGTQLDSRAPSPDGTSAPDAKVYPPNSRRCLLSFGDPNDCQCINGTPGASDPSACSTTSVATSPGQQGACCEDAFSCECIGYACVNGDSTATCACDQIGSAYLPASGTPVTECPAPAGNQKCCLVSNLHLCICSASACVSTGAVEVPRCSLSLVAVCSSDATALANCK